MAYTFGGGTGDDINLTAAGTMIANSRITFVCGWWLPTTLTATRGLWSAGDFAGVTVAAATTDVQLKTDNVTTAGLWTAPVGMVVNRWQFFAFLGSFNNTGPAAAWRVWAGAIETAPVEITVTNTVAPVGNFVATTNAAFTIGNVGTNTLAWRGDIEGVHYYNAASTARGLYEGAAFGAITNAEAEYVYRYRVLPLWLGESWGSGPLGVPTFFKQDNNAREFGYVPLTIDGTANVYDANAANNAPRRALTINGATLSNNRAPRQAPLHGLIGAAAFTS